MNGPDASSEALPGHPGWAMAAAQPPAGAALARRAPWQPGLRGVLAAAFGALGVLVALVSSAAIGQLATQRLRADIGAELAAAAGRAADLLDRGLHDRLREVRLAATLAPLRDPTANPAETQATLRWLHDIYPEYAAFFLIGADGRIRAASREGLAGLDVSQRDYFRHGQEGPVLVDVHEALLMSPLLGRPPENPARFVDLAAPLPGQRGHPAGVLAAHLFWEWAEDIERHVMGAVLRRHPGAEALVFSQDGVVLIGPPALRRRPLALLSPGAARALAAGGAGGEQGSLVEHAPDGDGRDYLVGYASTGGYRESPGLGWRVVVRREAGAAFAPARALARDVMFWGLGAATLAALLGWLLAGMISSPLARLCESAARLQRDPAAAITTPLHGPREVTALATALAALVAALRGRESALRAGAARLRLATEGTGLGTWEIDLASGASQRSPRHDAIFGHALPLPRWGWEDLLRHVAPEDRRRVARRLRVAVGRRREWELECRIHRADDGAERWIRCRGAPLPEGSAGACRYGGIVEDITARKEDERALELLVRELDHRVKNQFAVFDSLVQFTARGAADPAAMAETLRGRLRALGAAHDLVRESAGSGVARGLRPTRLDLLMGAVLGPFATGGLAAEERLRLQGPEQAVGPTAAAALALLLHEMVTNAARHGALRQPSGLVEIHWSASGGRLRLHWREQGGPPVLAPPTRRGFGTTLVRRTACGQLGGRVEFDWTHPEGLRLTIEIPLHRLEN
ncbi:PAS domain-containing protein [Roseomonas sp. GC11]|uniref:sensor histidine kinase n=1 Tax=Roseomonas sp. GC11 TaxID=2950546 RepID=UPI00210A8171|nr:HWE histidine kinase domain-containing protein [Roseomonas sp. GC11]MCQ4162170.1 PAS domain-containing protein [Roseomonas sp. GC11]